MSDMNHCIFQGNLVRDPELRTVKTQNGDVSVVSFTIACNVRKNAKAAFIRCEAWAEGADTIAKYFTKGKPIRVYAEFVTESYEKDGETVYRDKFRVSSFNFVNSGRPQNGEEGEAGEEEVQEEAPAKKPAAATKKTATKTTAKPTRKPVVEDEEDGEEIPF